MGQSYSFHKGQVTFSSRYSSENYTLYFSAVNRYYPTARLSVWEKHQEKMNESSVWWGCIYGQAVNQTTSLGLTKFQGQTVV